MTDTQPFPAAQPMAPRLAALLALNHALYTDHDLDVLLHRLLGMVIESLDAEAASLALIDTEAGQLVFQVAVGHASQRVECFRLPLGTGIAGWVAQHRETVRIDDARLDPRFLDRIDQATGFETRSMLCLPLVHGTRILGVIQAINKRHGPFTAADESLCGVLANMVAVSLENFQLHQLDQQRLGTAGSHGSLTDDEQKLLAVQELLASDHAFAGFLTSHQVPAILRGLADSHLSGKLTVGTGTGADDVAEIAIDHGDIVNASLPRRKLIGAEVVLEIQGWTAGVFRFDPQPIHEAARTIAEPLWLLLARGRERLIAIQRLAETFSGVGRLQPLGPMPEGDGVAAAIWPLLPARIDAVLAVAPGDRLSLYQGLARLVAAGSLGWAEEA
ncbi:MAG: GAF domain-containing protein [Candidatus Sericytochromatia bacterium]|nr:GAF domain-containing protein [Candidatus Sericytochromatia bacterium]